MKIGSGRIMLAIGCAVLAGCASGPKGDGGRPETIQKIGNGDEIDDAVALLDRGEVKAARRKLDIMLKRDPSDVRSRTLLSGLYVDPVAALGSRAFAYTVERGDTMQSLAQRFLGDRLKFHLLARYNAVAVAGSIVPGQVLRIPGDAPARRPPMARPRAEPAPVKVQPKAAAPKAAVRSAVSDPRRAAQLRAAGLAALNRGEVGRAVGLLSQARTADPSNALVRRDLDRARRIQATVKARR